MKDEEAVRKQYERHGVEGFYKKQGASYTNPHFLQIERLLKQNESRIDFSQILDFCCGSGEVTQVVRSLGYSKTTASDPFTAKAYQKNIGEDCFDWSFEDVMKGQLQGTYSAILSSFALHLCPEEQLFLLSYQLFQHTQQLVVITPHKRPALEQYEGIHLDFEDYTFTPKGKKVFLKSYSGFVGV